VITGIDHVQLAIPRGTEDEARSFYGDLLGMTELPKPAALVPRGCCWFTAGSAAVHLGIEEPFTAARKAHPALLVTDLDALQTRLTAAGYECVRTDGEIPGVDRFHTRDPLRQPDRVPAGLVSRSRGWRRTARPGRRSTAPR
jgi:catechol 2,3-dioxygenase-like lactoylglutathione lyase family enzyme